MATLPERCGHVSLRSEVGKLVLWAGFIYLIVQGCVIIRPARTIAVVSTLFGHFLGSCDGITGDTPIKQASFSEVVQGDVAPPSAPHQPPKIGCVAAAGIRQPSVPR